MSRTSRKLRVFMVVMAVTALVVTVALGIHSRDARVMVARKIYGEDGIPGLPPDIHYRRIDSLPIPPAVHDRTAVVPTMNGSGYPDMVHPRGLPAISDDGRFIAAAVYEVSRSLQIVIIEVESDRVLEEVYVFGSDEITRWELGHRSSIEPSPHPDQIVADEVDQNVRRANRLLEKRRYTPMELVEPRPFVGAECRRPPRQEAEKDGVRVTFEGGRLDIEKSKEPALYGTTHMDFSHLSKEACLGENAPLLEGVYLDGERRVVLLEFAFCGTELCPEPPARFHAQRLR